MMKCCLLILLFVFSSCAMHQGRKDTYHVAQNHQDSIIVHYKQKVDDYNVMMKIHGYGTPYCSVDFFFKDSKGGSISILGIDDYVFSYDEESMLDAGETEWIYPIPEDGDLLTHECPFFFFDIDYDGEKDIFINLKLSGIRGNDLYCVYDKNGAIKDLPPIESNTVINGEARTISTRFDYGLLGAVYTVHSFDNNRRTYILTDSTHIDTTMQDDMIVDSLWTVYKRRGNAMVLIETRTIKNHT